VSGKYPAIVLTDAEMRACRRTSGAWMKQRQAEVDAELKRLAAELSRWYTERD
jgi:hypothetical protein